MSKTPRSNKSIISDIKLIKIILQEVKNGRNGKQIHTA